MATSNKIKISKIKTKNVFLQSFFKLHQGIKFLNSNTLFVGLMMFVMNIASRFVNIKLSRSMEGYMKFSFSKDILVFAIAFIGTRDLYWALIITLIFILFMDYLLNEESSLCCLPETFTSHHIALLEDDSQNNSSKKVGNGMLGGIGVAVNNSSISGAPGLGYSTGSKDSNGNKIQEEENWGEMTEEEKKKVTEVLTKMRGGSPLTSFSSIGEIGNSQYISNDGQMSSSSSSSYSSYQ
jgi:hypothetical protein